MKKVKTFLKDPQSIIGLIILAVMLVMAIFAPVICPGNPIFSVGVPLQAPGQDFLLGTDYLGRDVWAMLVWGSRVSIIFAFGASVLSLLVGIVLGALSGYIGGWLDEKYSIDPISWRLNLMLIGFVIGLYYGFVWVKKEGIQKVDEAYRKEQERMKIDK